MYIKAKKSLGQNFLKSESAIKEIIEAGEVVENDFVLEIGPGKGDLTKKLLEKGAKILAIEKDQRLIEDLKEKFKQFEDNFEIIEADILDFDIEKIEKNYKLIANIPYYITGAILRKFLEANNQPILAVLLVQKEVAERIVGQNQSRINPKENLLSISVKVYSEPKLIKTVKAGSFLPIPKVDSAILKLSNISKKVFEENNISEEKFFTFVKAGFSHNRKKLSSNLEKLVDKKEFEKYLIKEKMNPSTRAEDLSLENWIKIVKKFI